MGYCRVACFFIFEQIGIQCICIKGEYTFFRELLQHFQLIQEAIQRTSVSCRRIDEVPAQLLQISRVHSHQIHPDDTVTNILVQRYGSVLLY